MGWDMREAYLVICRNNYHREWVNTTSSNRRAGASPWRPASLDAQNEFQNDARFGGSDLEREVAVACRVTVRIYQNGNPVCRRVRPTGNEFAGYMFRRSGP